MCFCCFLATLLASLQDLIGCIVRELRPERVVLIGRSWLYKTGSLVISYVQPGGLKLRGLEMAKGNKECSEPSKGLEMAKGINDYLRKHPVCCKYGAPLGRYNTRYDGQTLHLQKVDLSQGYDNSGVYWGSRAPGHRLYVAYTPDMEVEIYIDATSRAEAKKFFDGMNARFYK